jgi:hypothetical protein
LCIGDTGLAPCKMAAFNEDRLTQVTETPTVVLD